MHLKRSSSGWARLAAWLDAPSTRSSSVAFQFNHPPRFVISVPTLILAWVSRIMSPGWRGRASSTSVSFGLSVGRSLWILHTPWFEHWFWRDSTTATDSSVGRRSASSVRCRVSWCCLMLPTFKLCLLAHRCLHGSAPPYLIRYFTPVSSIAGRSHLRSAVTGTVFVPGSRTSTIGPRAFAISSPSAWNSLPVDLRDPGLSLLTFRRRLKTYLFNPPG